MTGRTKEDLLRDGPALRSLHIPAQKLLAALEPHVHDLTAAQQIARRRAIRRGYFTVLVADELCTEALHVHPVEVFGSQWIEEVGAY